MSPGPQLEMIQPVGSGGGGEGVMLGEPKEKAPSGWAVGRGPWWNRAVSSPYRTMGDVHPEQDVQEQMLPFRVLQLQVTVSHKGN